MVDSSRYIALRLQKEKQDEDQRLAKQALQQRNMQMILSTGLDAAQSIGGIAMKAGAQSKQDGIANALMNQQTPPRAEAVDPALNAQMRQQGLGPTAPRTGGVDELKLSMAMEDQKNQNMASALSVAREGRMNQAQDDSYTARQMQAATNAARATNQKTKDMVTAANAYVETSALLEKSMKAAQASGDFDGYNSAARKLQAVHLGTVSAGVKLPPLVIPDFSGPAPGNEGAFNDAMNNWQNTRGAAMQVGGWDEGGKMGIPFIRDSVPSNGQRYMTASEELNKQKAAFVKRPVDKYQPESNTVQLPAQAGAGQMPAGQVIRNKSTGQMMRWNGSAWENI